MTRLRVWRKERLGELKVLLDEINDRVEIPEYIQLDPVQFMHLFQRKQDAEIAGFLGALMAWGRRDIVISKGMDLMERMEFHPFEFVMNYRAGDRYAFEGFRHRTLKPVDLHGLILTLQSIYLEYPDFEGFWADCRDKGAFSGKGMMQEFYEQFTGKHEEFQRRTRKHIANAGTGSTCKRLYMYLRWCCRQNSPVDPGIWTFLKPAELMVPFDVHVARISRRYGLLSRRSNDMKAVQELTGRLKEMDSADPVRYDYALFALGALNETLPSRFILNR